MNVKTNECIKRLEILKAQGLLTDIDIIKIFEKGSMCISEPNMVLGQPCGVIFDIESKPKYKKIFNEEIKPRLQRLNAVPYFGIVQNTSFGLMFMVFYVSESESNWETERDELRDKSICAYVYNIDESFGEVGYIDYGMFNGGPIRTA